FNGADTRMRQSFLAYDAGFSGGVRVACVDADGDAQADVVTRQGPGGGQVCAFGGLRHQPLASGTPFRASFTGGLFVGAGPVGGLDPAGGGATVTVVASTPDVLENGGVAGVFTLTRSGDTSSSLDVSYTLTGTAEGGGSSPDYVASQPSDVLCAAGSATATVTITPVDDSLFENSETVVLTVLGGPGTSHPANPAP